MEKAYITVLTQNNYLGGVEVLKKSLDLVNSKYPLYVVVPKEKADELVPILEERGMQVILEDGIDKELVEDIAFKRAYWRDTLFKLCVYRLTRFEKIVFLDADMIVFRNIDHLFDAPHMSAADAGAEIYGWHDQLNSGLMVIEPSESEFMGLMRCVGSAYQKRCAENLAMGDQDVIKYYYKSWSETKELHLDSTYNVMIGCGAALYRQGRLSGFGDIYVYHFTGKQKPWRGFTDNIAVILKIIKHRGNWIDLKVYFEYRKILKMAQA